MRYLLLLLIIVVFASCSYTFILQKNTTSSVIEHKNSADSASVSLKIPNIKNYE